MAEVAAEIFKAYDIRGIVGKTLTTSVARQIGQAFGSEARLQGQDTVVIGRDGRLSGPDLVDALSEGLQHAGIDVIDIGLAPTPVVYYAAHHFQCASCIAVTGSHNPPDYNGFKMVIAGTTLSGDTIQRLRARIENDDYLSGNGNFKSETILADYIQRITDDIKLARPLNVVVDCGNGVAGVIATDLLSALGCNVTALYCEVDGTFPNHHPDPSKPENLQDLIQAVAREKADIGLAFDGDGDRLGVITSDGTVIWPDRQMMLYAIDILQRNPGAEIIFDIKCTTNLPRIIREHGGRPLMWRTGHSLVKAKLKETGAPLAGEMSGHIFFQERWYGFDDATYTAARLLEILARDKRSSTEIFTALPDSVNTPELNVLMKEGEHYRFVEKLLQNANFDDAEITTIDGLRVDFSDGFGLVRASNTTPSLVIRFEGNSSEALQRIQERFRKLMKQTDPAIILPF